MGNILVINKTVGVKMKLIEKIHLIVVSDAAPAQVAKHELSL